MNTKLEELREAAFISQQVCLEAMDRRFTCAAAMANLYFKALHAYRVELRRVRKGGRVSTYTDVGSWFEVINSRLCSYGLQGPCMRVHRNTYIGYPWDKLLIEFGSGVKKWIRRENTKLVSANFGGSK